MLHGEYEIVESEEHDVDNRVHETLPWRRGYYLIRCHKIFKSVEMDYCWGLWRGNQN